MHSTKVENAAAQSLTKAARLRAMLKSDELEFILEAHNGLSAKIVEEAGFKGIWASGLSISAALGVRDNNEASWTQVIDVLEFMSDASTVPILMDGDTGFGNFNNMRRLVRKLEQRDIAGVAIEDKLFPKTNSFIGEAQPLADVDEFCGKIKAGKDSQSDDDFSIIARVEALIAGWGLGEALRRSEAYRKAGADAILIHSKKADANEILAFAKEWADRSPLVIVPTMYYRTPTDAYREASISLAIWANHNLRTAITAMRNTSREIYENQSLVSVEDRVVTVADVFTLQDNDELKRAEQRYLPKTRDKGSAIVLAASRGATLGPLTEDRPKCMIDVRGKPLLLRMVETFNSGGIRKVTVVRGYRKEMVDIPGIHTVDNDDYADTGEVRSLIQAKNAIKADTLVAYGDILFGSTVLSDLSNAQHDVTLVVDPDWRHEAYRDADRAVDLVICETPYTRRFLDRGERVSVNRIGQDVRPDQATGEWIGLLRMSERGAELLREALNASDEEDADRTLRLPDLVQRLIDAGADVGAVYLTEPWLDVDNAIDLATARNMV